MVMLEQVSAYMYLTGTTTLWIIHIWNNDVFECVNGK